MLATLKQLFSSIVDYAGLFPPAQLQLPDAMVIYDHAQASSNRWLVGRFVLPAASLPALVALLPTVLEPGHTTSWSLSVILSKNWAAELEQIRQLQAANDQVLIHTFEVTLLPPSDIQHVCRHLPVGITVFFEVPLSADLEPYIPILQQSNAAAKLRTGGLTSDTFPDSAQLAQAILSLAKAHIPFKATAGLHHPLRGDRRLTAKPNSVSATMHGFLNVALLAALAYQQSISLRDAIALLEEQSIHAFHFTEMEISWRHHTLSLAALERSRHQFFHSFGSCSIQEPIDDLHTLRLL